jgi:hypothetical protein
MSKISFIFLALLSLLASSAHAQCAQRDVSGDWNIQLGEFKDEVRLTLRQSGNTISGTASDTGAGPFLDFEETLVDGTVTGDKISLSIDHKRSRRLNGTSLLESFEGTFRPDGKISGRARVMSLAGVVGVDWTSDRAMKCLSRAVKGLGVKHTEPGGGTGGGTVTAPWIVASPNNIQLPLRQGTGLTTLTWDAGKDHPYAEVWVSIDGQDEHKIIELGKGTIQQPIVVGKAYLFILTDNGTTLATVPVSFRQ